MDSAQLQAPSTPPRYPLFQRHTIDTQFVLVIICLALEDSESKNHVLSVELREVVAEGCVSIRIVGAAVLVAELPAAVSGSLAR